MCSQTALLEFGAPSSQTKEEIRPYRSGLEFYDRTLHTVSTAIPQRPSVTPFGLLRQFRKLVRSHRLCPSGTIRHCLRPLIPFHRPPLRPDETGKAAENACEDTEKAMIIFWFGEKLISLHRNRKVAQLVAHYVRDVGVGRSSRLIPTKKRLCRN